MSKQEWERLFKQLSCEENWARKCLDMEAMMTYKEEYRKDLISKKDLIKKILELGKELEKANGFDALMIINDMEIEVDNYTKQLLIHKERQK